MIQLRNHLPSGEVRNWKLREIVEGQPLGHPSHALVVHFPVAYYIAVLSFDIMTRVATFPTLVLAGTFLIIGAFAGSAIAVPTGLVDWWQMAKGSAKRRKATQHLLLQLTTFGVFLVALILRWPHRHQAQASISWIVVEAIGVSTLVVGQYLGGILVYQMAMRVRTTRRSEPRSASPAATPPATLGGPASTPMPPAGESAP
ncbi:MAG TPA: DUF2231 domain-containing protein [Actinomycetota bacterium]